MRMGFREKHQRSTATFQQQDIIVRSYESTYDTVRESIDPTDRILCGTGTCTVQRLTLFLKIPDVLIDQKSQPYTSFYQQYSISMHTVPEHKL